MGWLSEDTDDAAWRGAMLNESRSAAEVAAQKKAAKASADKRRRAGGLKNVGSVADIDSEISKLNAELKKYKGKRDGEADQASYARYEAHVKRLQGEVYKLQRMKASARSKRDASQRRSGTEGYA